MLANIILGQSAVTGCPLPPVSLIDVMRHALAQAEAARLSIRTRPSVARVVTAVAGGRVINPKTARSQVLGGIVWGIGMALEEESVIDQDFGRFVNHNLAEYHVPVNTDAHEIEGIFVEG